MVKHDTVSIPAANSWPLSAPGADRVAAGRHERPGYRLAAEVSSPAQHEEVLVVDERAALRPAQVVESKLTRLLQETSLPVSHLQMRGLVRAR
jgi:hypothetical protein